MTHTNLGPPRCIIILPNEERDIFIKKYCQDLLNGVQTFMCERRTSETFRLFMDLDCEIPKIYSEDFSSMMLEEVIPYLCACIYECIIDVENLDCVISTTPDKVKYIFQDKLQFPMVYAKIGYHVTFLDFVVTSDQCMKIREHILPKLQKKFGSRFKNEESDDLLRPSYELNFHKIYDSSVYIGNGLRMIGSKKYVARCGDCNKFKKILQSGCCPTCNGDEKYVDYNVYWPTHILRVSHKIELYDTVYAKDTLDQIITAVNHTVIRATEEEKKNTIELVPGVARRRVRSDTSAFKRKRTATETDENAYSSRESGESQIKEETSISRVELGDYLEQCIRILLPLYSDVYVTKVKKISFKSSSGYMYSINTESHFCMNINGEHNSTTVYFVITASGIRQYCYCRCTDKTCHSYKGELYPLTDDMRKYLFPGFKKPKDKTKPPPPAKRQVYVPGNNFAFDFM